MDRQINSILFSVVDLWRTSTFHPHLHLELNLNLFFSFIFIPCEIVFTHTLVFLVENFRGSTVARCVLAPRPKEVQITGLIFSTSAALFYLLFILAAR